jgi:UDP-glucose 4-epimerase
MVSIVDLVNLIGSYFGREFRLETSAIAEGGTKVRCPDISKLTALGYKPKVPLAEGIVRTIEWYVANPIDSENSLL